MEFCQNGDLTFFLLKYAKDNSKLYSLKERFRFLQEVALAINFLHSKSILHRDLKLENVLLDKAMTCKLMDFGLSKIVDRMSQQKTARIGTSIYMCPEIVLNWPYNEKCDVFSFSIMMWVILTGNFYPYGLDNVAVEIKVASNPDYRPDVEQILIPDSSSSEIMRNLVSQNWEADPRKRMTFPEIRKVLQSQEEVFQNLKGEEQSQELLIVSQAQPVNMKLLAAADSTRNEEKASWQRACDRTEILRKQNADLQVLAEELVEKKGGLERRLLDWQQSKTQTAEVEKVVEE